MKLLLHRARLQQANSAVARWITAAIMFLAVFACVLSITSSSPLFGDLSAAKDASLVSKAGPIAHGPDDLRFMVTIDAGSSGSRVHVHTYQQIHGESLPSVRALFTLKINPGLSSFVDDPSGAHKSIRDLLDHSLDHVPRAQWRRTPVFLKATAGLRSVKQEIAAEILQQCAEAIERTAFFFRPEWVSVISGKEEGKFGWVAANYLMGRFGGQTNAHLGTVGVIEMGGASMQMSFVPSDGIVDPKYAVPMVIGGQVHNLYTHSFLGYGLEQAFEQLQSQIGSVEHNPCLPKGVQPTFLNADGDFDKCSALMPTLLQLDKFCAKTCSLNGIYQPSHHGVEFVAIENFFYTSEFFDVVEVPDQLDEAARPYCKMEFSSIQSKYNGIKKIDELRKTCFNAAYIHSVLTKGFGFPEPFERVKVVKNVNGVGIDWAIGSVLYEAMNLLPAFIPPKLVVPAVENNVNDAFPYTNGWIFLLPFVVVALAFILLRTVRQRSRANMPYPYSAVKKETPGSYPML